MAEEKKGVAKSSDSNLFGALCYIIGVIVPLFVLFTEKKNDRFLAFHAWQSLALTVGMTVVWVGFMVVLTVLAVVSGGIAGILSCLMLPLMLVILLLVLYAAYKAYLGEKYKLPIIGDFAEKQANK